MLLQEEETVQKRANSVRVPAPCSYHVPSNWGLLFVVMGGRKWNPCLLYRCTSSLLTFLSLFLFQCKCQTVIFRVNQMDEQKRHSAPPHTHSPPPPLWHERSCWWESRLRHFGSSIQQAAKRNLLFKPLLVQLVWLMWQLATELPPSHICHSTIMWPWRQYGSRILDNARQPSGSPSDMSLRVFQTHFVISITESVFQLLQTSWRWSSSLDGCRCPPVCQWALERSHGFCTLKWTLLLFSSARSLHSVIHSFVGACNNHKWMRLVSEKNQAEIMALVQTRGQIL